MGAIRPRHWYEVELIVPIEITTAEGYPKRDSVIRVYTDDGWRFNCKIQEITERILDLKVT